MQNQKLDSSNFAELFAKDTTWIIDDSFIFRAELIKTADQELTTKRLNGALFILNPVTGRLFVKILPKTFAENQIGLSEFIKSQTTEILSSICKSLPLEEQPKYIIFCRERLMESFLNQKEDFNQISIKLSEINFPFGSFFKISRIQKLISAETNESPMYQLDLFDDWQNHISSYTCFCRLFLIIRSFSICSQQTDEILTSPNNVHRTDENHFWPTMSDNNWIEKELQMKN